MVINMSDSAVRVCKNDRVEIRRTFSSAFLLVKNDGKPPLIRGYGSGQPVMEIDPASDLGYQLVALGLVWECRSLPRCPYCRRKMGTGRSFRNYLQRSCFNPSAVLNECTACGAHLCASEPLFDKVELDF
jgi:hypothetical protein